MPLPLAAVLVPAVALLAVAFTGPETPQAAPPPGGAPPPGPVPPGPAPGGVQPPAGLPPDVLAAFTEVRMVEGVATRFFKTAAASPVLDVLGKSSVVPATIDEAAWQAAGGAFGLALNAQKAGHAMILSVVPQAPGIANAGDTIRNATAMGLAVIGTLNLVTLEGAGRAIVIARAQVRPILAAVDLQGPFAVLVDSVPADERAIPRPPSPYGAPPKGPTEMPDNQPVIAPPVAPPVDELDPGMPQATRAEVEALLASTTVSPDALELAAADLAPTYPRAAAKLRARAAELRQLEKLEHIQRGSSPFTVRQGDLPSIVAQHYTGEGGRWHEIKKAGIALTQANLATKWNGVVDLPLGWEAWAKPLPPVAHGAAATAPPKKKKNGAVTPAERQRREEHPYVPAAAPTKKGNA